MFAQLGLFLAAIVVATTAQSDCQFSLESADNTRLPQRQFMITLLREIRKRNPDKNIIYSPVSIALALALVEAGAAGGTQTELKNILAPAGFNGDVSSLYQSLQHELRIQEEHAKLSVANALFYDSGFTLKDEYLNKVKTCFETAIESVSFAQTEPARQKINNWASNATAQKIPELIKPGVLPAGTKAVLANAIYLKAAWQKPFNQTEDLQFYELGKAEKAKTVKFLVRTGTYEYAGNDDYEMLQIPYKSAPINFHIIKAKAPKTGVSAVESSFRATPPSQMWENARRRNVELKIPKFTIRLPTDLTTVLPEIGLPIIFSNSADFSRMDPSNGIKVTKVVHEAYIKINENGTEAAAATAVMMNRKSLGPIPSPEPPIPFIADAPFLFSIVHEPTGAFLFAGQVNSIENESN